LYFVRRVDWVARRRGRSPHWVKVKNPKAPAVKREAEEDWGKRRPARGWVTVRRTHDEPSKPSAAMTAIMPPRSSSKPSASNPIEASAQHRFYR
jgi:hypothetical protein